VTSRLHQMHEIIEWRRCNGWWSCSSGPASARFEATFAAELKEVFGIRDRGEAHCRHVADLIDLRITESASGSESCVGSAKDLTGLAAAASLIHSMTWRPTAARSATYKAVITAECSTMVVDGAALSPPCGERSPLAQESALRVGHQ
jgi:hypothetical protein